MNITRYEPRNYIRELSDDFNRLLAPRMGTFLPIDETDLSMSGWLPAVDIKEEDNRFLVKADIPGVQPKDVEVTMENGVLTIKGTRESEIKEDRDDYYRVERVAGEFYRRFTLPDSADPEKINAHYDKGVLEIEIGKGETHKPKRIPVKAS